MAIPMTGGGRGSAEIPAEHVARLRALLEKAVADGYFAGITSVAVQRGKVLQCDAWGHRDVEDGAPMTTDTICRIASSTKPIIAVAMMILHEEGRWDFDDPVSKYVPELADLKVREKDGTIVEPVQPMAMRHLMSHAAGFGRGLPFARRGGERDGERSEERAPARPRLRRNGATLQTLIDRLASEPLAFHPGKRFLYGPCCDVQGYIIEKLSGQTLDRFLEERIFTPLGMADTGFWVDASKADRVASLYRYEGGQLERIAKPTAEQVSTRPTFLSGGGGLWSTADDYQRFCQMLQDEGAVRGGEGRVLTAETVRKMRVDLLEPQVYVQVVAGYKLPGARFGTNVSVITEPQGDNAMYGKDTYSWGGAFGTYFWIDPTNELFVSGMVQIMNGGAQHLGQRVEYPDLKKLSAEVLYLGQPRT